MSAPNLQDQDHHDSKENIALRYYQQKHNALINDSRVHQSFYYISQIAAVVLSGIAPILIIKNAPKDVQAAAPALASIAAGLSMYKWKENWIRCKVAAENMESEMMKYQLHASEYSVDSIESSPSLILVTRLIDINDAHLRSWRAENEIRDPQAINHPKA